MKKLKNQLFSPAVLVLLVSILVACNSNQQKKEVNNKKEVSMQLDWSKNANIYEVNIRQYTEEGTINAFMEHLPRLEEMGVDILWIMPVFPVGELNRKGSLGSYYAVRDYKDINPEFGDLDDFKALVKKAHELNMYVILDWVANHSAWDNQWAEDHPDWYERDSAGKLVSPFDWSDVISFEYNNPEMRDAMIDALKFWIAEADIDGYRCDVAGMVPTDFWDKARDEMTAIKPVFMLAEDEDNPDLLRKAFDMNYGWKLHHKMNDITKGEKNANDIWDYFVWNDSTYPTNAYRMYFTSNHDENSWNGTVKERMGDAGEVMAVLSYTVPGMGLIYSGQEAGLDKRLRFFEKDTINWDNLIFADLYTTLNNLKKENPALWNGNHGGTMTRLGDGSNQFIYSFIREKDDRKVIAILNLCDKPQSFSFNEEKLNGKYTNAFTGDAVNVDGEMTVELQPWKYLVLSK